MLVAVLKSPVPGPETEVLPAVTATLPPRPAAPVLLSSRAPVPRVRVPAFTWMSPAAPVPEVVEKSPAAQSGLHAGDLVLAIDSAPLGDAQSLQKHLFADAIGQRMEVTVLRNGALVDAVVLPSELPD